MSTPILHVDPDAFLVDSFRLGRAVYASGFRPTHAISLWRGGTPVGLGVDAFFRSRGLVVSHTTIATGAFSGIHERGEVVVRNLEHLVQVVCREDDLLILDDVYESGRTIRRVVEQLRARARENAPRNILVAAIHRKPALAEYDELPVVALRDIEPDTWIDYPHELADLADRCDPDDARILEKGADIHAILRAGPQDPLPRPEVGEPFIYLSARELLLDSLRLGVKVASDEDYHPDFMVALWPGGVLAGLPVHEVYKYFLKKRGGEQRAPDHISINTSPTRASTESAVIGLNYLEEHVNKDDNVLIIDTTFRAGRMVNDVVNRLKEVLRRNLDHRRVRVACVYHNPEDDSTWTVRPDIRRPHYHVREVRSEVIYPASVHKLPNLPVTLRRLNPALWEVLYADCRDPDATGGSG